MSIIVSTVYDENNELCDFATYARRTRYDRKTRKYVMVDLRRNPCTKKFEEILGLTGEPRWFRR